MEAIEAKYVQLRRGYQELLTRVNHMDRSATQRLGELSRAYVKIQGDPRQGYQKEISESKAAISLKVLTEERTQYKAWHAQFVNAMSQVRPDIRDVLKEIDREAQG